MNKERIIEILQFIASSNIGGSVTIYNNLREIVMRVAFSNYTGNMTIIYRDVDDVNMCLVTHKSNVDTIWDAIGERINPALFDKDNGKEI